MPSGPVDIGNPNKPPVDFARTKGTLSNPTTKRNINTSGLLRGTEDVRQAQERKQRLYKELIESLKDPEGLKNLLRELAANEKLSGAYRVQAANALLKADEDSRSGGLCWKCSKDITEVPKSVADWIDA